jgi:hypothetical protein
MENYTQWCIVQELQSSGTRARVDTSKSVLTKLLAHSLGGNAYTLLIGSFVQGEPSESEALLKHMQVTLSLLLHAL